MGVDFVTCFDEYSDEIRRNFNLGSLLQMFGTLPARRPHTRSSARQAFRPFNQMEYISDAQLDKRFSNEKHLGILEINQYEESLQNYSDFSYSVI